MREAEKMRQLLDMVNGSKSKKVKVYEAAGDTADRLAQLYNKDGSMSGSYGVKLDDLMYAIENNQDIKKFGLDCGMTPQDADLFAKQVNGALMGESAMYEDDESADEATSSEEDTNEVSASIEDKIDAISDGIEKLEDIIESKLYESEEVSNEVKDKLDDLKDALDDLRSEAELDTLTEEEEVSSDVKDKIEDLADNFLDLKDEVMDEIADDTLTEEEESVEGEVVNQLMSVEDDIIDLASDVKAAVPEVLQESYNKRHMSVKKKVIREFEDGSAGGFVDQDLINHIKELTDMNDHVYARLIVASKILKSKDLTTAYQMLQKLSKQMGNGDLARPMRDSIENILYAVMKKELAPADYKAVKSAL